jgi:hypothetical protein
LRKLNQQVGPPPALPTSVRFRQRRSGLALLLQLPHQQAHLVVAVTSAIRAFRVRKHHAKAALSGVMTFIMSENEKLYETNLGKDSTAIGAKMSASDPGVGWKDVAQ